MMNHFGVQNLRICCLWWVLEHHLGYRGTTAVYYRAAEPRSGRRPGVREAMVGFMQFSLAEIHDRHRAC